jgi:hypothetical protein
MSESPGPGGYDVRLAEDDPEIWDGGADDDPRSLAELINRVLDRGVVIAGDVTISVAGVDLVYLGLNAVLTSISTARRAGMHPGHHGGAPGPGDGGG